MWWDRKGAVGIVHEHAVTDVLVQRAPLEASLSSAVDCFDFEFRCTVVWNAPPGSREGSRQAVATMAAARLCTFQPTEWRRAEIELADELSEPKQLAKKLPALAWTEDLTVRVESSQLELAERYAQRIRQRVLLDAEHDLERAELRYLKHSVFADTASAAVWWLRHNNYDVVQLNEMIKSLKATVAIVADSDEQDWADTIIGVFDAVAPNLNRSGRYELHQRLARILHGVGEAEKAKTLLSRADGTAQPDSGPSWPCR